MAILMEQPTMPASAKQVREYRERLKVRAAIAVLGTPTKRCQHCDSTEQCEFAHLEPTGLSGAGRGLDRRYRDVIKYPQRYGVMCKACHRWFDARENEE